MINRRGFFGWIAAGLGLPVAGKVVTPELPDPGRRSAVVDNRNVRSHFMVKHEECSGVEPGKDLQEISRHALDSHHTYYTFAGCRDSGIAIAPTGSKVYALGQGRFSTSDSDGPLIGYISRNVFMAPEQSYDQKPRVLVEITVPWELAVAAGWQVSRSRPSAS